MAELVPARHRLRSGASGRGPARHARVVKWYTRTFQGRVPQGMGVQISPLALRRWQARTWVSAKGGLTVS